MASSRMSGGVASAMRSGRLNTPPNTAIVVAQSSATVSVAPATALTLPGSPAPQAWPIRTVAPELSPITKATKKNITGKNTETAASASTPIIWPRYTLLMVPNNACRILLSIMGARKTRNVFQRGGFDTGFPHWSA